jgi:hypothetical protein
MTGSHFFFRRKLARLVLEHYRDVVLDGVAEAAGPANELGLRLAIEERPLAERADQYVEQFGVHGDYSKSMQPQMNTDTHR